MSNQYYKFNEKMQIKDPLRVFFLCGSAFTKNDPNDKRNVLKSYIESLNINYKVIILEEHFVFGKMRSGYLSYDHIFMKNLKDIELLTGLFSDKIIILHESISTAAELGMFSSNKDLFKKTCILTPDYFAVEEEKVSNFIRLAFLNSRTPEESVKRITYYPKTNKNIVSNVRTEYHTYFPQNKIKGNLALNINSFIMKDYKEVFEITFKKQKFSKAYTDDSIISYNYNKSELNLNFPIKIIRILLVTIFSLDEFRVKIRSSIAIKDAVSALEDEFKSILKNTLSEIEATDFKNHKLIIGIKDNNIPFRNVIGYFLYTLQAIGMVKLPSDKSKKFIISPIFKILYDNNLIKQIKPSKFTGLL
ncbi:hypothetical protein [Cytobacillus praedii]|uniref:hypothetical protein n=1 Tax=Cytobacillus praedii TaxID=1742358 RepID=UPI003AF5D2DA